MKQMKLDDFNFEIHFTRRFPVSKQEMWEKRLRVILEYFPELRGQTTRKLKVGIIDQSLIAAGRAKDTDQIWLRMDASIWTVAHEFTHLVQAVQYEDGVPKEKRIPFGEKACDLYTLARSRDLLDQPPHYLKLPFHVRYTSWPNWAGICHRVAKEAIDRRKAGLRNYIKWFETRIDRIATDFELENTYRGYVLKGVPIEEMFG